MKRQEEKTISHPVLYAIKSFFEKLRQNPDVYPIKYYKKVARLKKRGPAV